MLCPWAARGCLSLHGATSLLGAYWIWAGAGAVLDLGLLTEERAGARPCRAAPSAALTASMRRREQWTKSLETCFFRALERNIKMEFPAFPGLYLFTCLGFQLKWRWLHYSYNPPVLTEHGSLAGRDLGQGLVKLLWESSCPWVRL